MTDLSKLFFNFHGPDDEAETGDWHSIMNGCWAIPEGTRAEWLHLVNAIEHSGIERVHCENGRLGMSREADDSIRVFSPRNEVSSTGGLHIAKGDLPRFCDMVRRALGGEPIWGTR
ncbi:MAG: hypothetical protein HOW73_47715 [Polyangiaceae bacterium]|nr:hypothetical protein [Polyangiaceae bacterium]